MARHKWRKPTDEEAEKWGENAEVCETCEAHRRPAFFRFAWVYKMKAQIVYQSKQPPCTKEP